MQEIDHIRGVLGRYRKALLDETIPSNDFRLQFSAQHDRKTLEFRLFSEESDEKLVLIADYALDILAAKKSMLEAAIAVNEIWRERLDGGMKAVKSAISGVLFRAVWRFRKAVKHYCLLLERAAIEVNNG